MEKRGQNSTLMDEFYRIYWLEKFNWRDYSSLYDKYCKSKDNYYSSSSLSILDSVNVKGDFVVLDLACGTGAFSKVILDKFPNIKIIAIDISKEAIDFYRKNFKKEIASGQIEVFVGDIEKIQDYVDFKVDLIFLSSALWDLNLNIFFRNIGSVMKKSSKLIANIPSVILGKPEGFIHEIEKVFELELGIEKKYRRIDFSSLGNILDSNDLEICKNKDYEFWTSKSNIKLFFDVLKYRYPFIFFPEETSYEENYEKCKIVFNKMLDNMSDKGLVEKGQVLVISKE